MRVLVCGGRDYVDMARVYEVLDKVHATCSITELVHGAARGADTLAATWAAQHGVPRRAFPADWRTHGRRAGILRNTDMLLEAHPALVVAFPGGRGTADMARQSRAAGIEVQVVPPRESAGDAGVGAPSWFRGLNLGS